MYFQFLIEDPSGQILVERVMEKIKAVHPGMEYSCKSFHGIGGFTRRNTVKETKDGSAKLKKDGQSYRSIGTVKCEWARLKSACPALDHRRIPSENKCGGMILCLTAAL